MSPRYDLRSTRSIFSRSNFVGSEDWKFSSWLYTHRSSVSPLCRVGHSVNGDLGFGMYHEIMLRKTGEEREWNISVTSVNVTNKRP